MGLSNYQTLDPPEPGMDVSQIPATKHSRSHFIYVLSFFATIGGLLFGYDIGIVSGAVLLIKPHFHLTTIWTETVVSGTVAAAAVAALCAGYLTDMFGRKKVVMVASVLFVGGAVVMGASPTKEILLVGRIVAGLGVGFASMTVPIYVAESAPFDMRGRLVTLNQLMITIGILISSIIAGAFSEIKDTGWRYMLGLGGIPAVIQFIGFLYLPESPRWLVDRGREEEAQAVLRRVRNCDDVEKEMDRIRESVVEAKKAQETDGSFVITKVCGTAHVRRAVFVGSGLMFFQQVCGINTVIYYSATIMRMAGFPVSSAIWLVVLPNSVNFLSTFIGLWLIDRLGRRILILASLAGIFIALAVLAIGFQLAAFNSPDLGFKETFNKATYDGECTTKYTTCNSCIENTDCGFCYDIKTNGSCLPVDSDDNDRSSIGRCSENFQSNLTFQFDHQFCPNDYGLMPVFGMVLFVFAFAPGMGPVPWTINSEIYPLWARSTCNSISTATNWVMNLFVSFTFLTLTENITKYGTFWLFGGFCLLGLVFIAVFLPETKNKTLEEVEELFMSSQTVEERSRFRKSLAVSKGFKKPKETDEAELIKSDSEV